MGILYAIATQNKQDPSTICNSCGIYESNNRSQCAACPIEQRRQQEVTEAQQLLKSALDEVACAK